MIEAAGVVKGEPGIIGPHEIGFGDHPHRFLVVVGNQDGVHLVLDGIADGLLQGGLGGEVNDQPPHGLFDRQILHDVLATTDPHGIP